MRPLVMSLLVCWAVTSWSDTALSQTAYLEGHVFNKRSGVPIEGAVVVITENVTLGPLPILLADDATDGNGFYQAGVTTAFPIAIIQVVCRTRSGAVVRGASSAPLRDDVIQRRDIYLEAPRRLRRCQAPQPGDIPPSVD